MTTYNRRPPVIAPALGGELLALHVDTKRYYTMIDLRDVPIHVSRVLDQLRRWQLAVSRA